MNIPVVNAVRKNLFRQQRHQALRERVAVIAQPNKFIDLIDLNTFQLFHDQNFVGTEFLVDQRYFDGWIVGENLMEFLRVVHFTLEIHLHADRLVELFHDAMEVQVAQFYDVSFEQGNEAAQQINVGIDQRLNTGTLDLHDHRFAGSGQARRMYLRKRCRAQGSFRKIRENRVERLPVLALHHRNSVGQRHGLDTVLQPRQLVSDTIRQQVAPRAEHLTELDKGGAQTLACRT